MAGARSRGVGMLAVVLLAVVAGLGWYLEHAHDTQRDALARGFEERAALTAKVTAGALSSTGADDLEELEQEFGGPVAGLGRRLAAYDRKYGVPLGAVVDADGRVIASHPPGLTAEDLGGMTATDLRPGRIGENRIGDLTTGGDDPSIMVATTFQAPDGLRAQVSPVAAAEIASFAGSYLDSAPAVRGARAVLIDSRRRILSGDGTVGARAPRIPPDRQVATAPVRGTRWTVVFSAPEDELFAPVQGPTRILSIALLAALALALLAALALARSVVRRTAEVTAAREQERVARELAHERLHDPLTGLPNRGLFLDRTAEAVGRADRTGRTLGVMFIDIDRFKRINDSLGHAAGDEVLATMAERLRREVRAGDTVSRFGGDEFLVLSDHAREGEVLALCARLHRAIQEPLHLGGRELTVCACIGIALLHPDDEPQDPEALIRDADTAMYRAKQLGSGSTAVFDEALNRRALERLDTELALSAALEEGQLILHYQPVVATSTGRIAGMEALVRWNRPGRGLVGPAEFIGIAEDSGRIIAIGEWVLRTACSDLAELRRNGEVADDVEVSVNLSPVQLMHDGLVATVERALRDSGLPPERLWLEVTENAVMADVELGVETLRRLKHLGVRLAMDDFGIGHSSLGHIARLLPIDVLKLDRSFVLGIANPREYAIVAAVAGLGAALDLVTVAEGVETAETARTIAELGYDIGQGYFWHRPQPLTELRPILLPALPAVEIA